MKTGLVAGVVAVATALAAGGWYYLGGPNPVPRSTSAGPPPTVEPEGGGDVVTVDPDGGQTIDPGVTPMRERVAVVGLLNKRNGVTRDLTLRPNQAMRVGDTIVRLRACEQTAPWEQQKLTGAFVQLDVQGADRRWRRAFSGWLFKERPQLNVVLHPVYDVWIKSCTMSFPVTGPDTVSAAAPSSAKKPADGAGSADAPAIAKEVPVEPSAADSNAT